MHDCVIGQAGGRAVFCLDTVDCAGGWPELERWAVVELSWASMFSMFEIFEIFGNVEGSETWIQSQYQWSQMAGNMEARAGLPVCSEIGGDALCLAAGASEHRISVGSQEAGGAGLPQQLSPHLPLSWTMTILLPPGLQFSATPTPTPRPKHIDDDHDDQSLGQRCHSAWTTNCPHLPNQPVTQSPQAPAIYYRRISQMTNRLSLLSLAGNNHSAGGASKLAFEKPLRHILIILPATGLAQPARPRDRQTAFDPFRFPNATPTSRHPAMAMR